MTTAHQEMRYAKVTYMITYLLRTIRNKTRGSATAEEPRDALRQLKYYGRFD